jgi:hypothetical protein
MKLLSGVAFWGRLLALSTNIKLGWKGLPCTNTIACYAHLKVAFVKRLITMASDMQIFISVFFSVVH